MTSPHWEQLIACPGELDRFDLLCDWAMSASSLPQDACNKISKISACDTGLWCRVACENGRLTVAVESDSLFVKGLALLLAELSQSVTPQALLAAPPTLGEALLARRWIPLERARGLAEMEDRILAAARGCQDQHNF